MIISQTSWTDTIEGKTAPWYETAIGWASGWCFGGYVKMASNLEIPISSRERGSAELEHSFVLGADAVRAPKLPYLDMKIFGIEAEPHLPNSQVTVSFDDLNYQMLLKPQTTPVDSLGVEVIDPDGRKYSKDFGADRSPRFYLYKEDAHGALYDQPLVAFTFLPPANASAGTWNFRLTIDLKPSSRKYALHLRPMTATLSTDRRPDPFGPPTNAVTSAGGTLYLYGRD
jgi:hypothetical protein